MTIHIVFMKIINFKWSYQHLSLNKLLFINLMCLFVSWEIQLCLPIQFICYYLVMHKFDEALNIGDQPLPSIAKLLKNWAFLRYVKIYSLYASFSFSYLAKIVKLILQDLTISSFLFVLQFIYSINFHIFGIDSQIFRSNFLYLFNFSIYSLKNSERFILSSQFYLKIYSIKTSIRILFNWSLNQS